MVRRAVETASRETWSTQLGFLLAAIGSAIGLGNIWRFPGVAYSNGGGAFILPYLIALLTAGIPFLILDYALGHRYRGGAPTVFRRIGRWWESLGWVQVLICMVILAYYVVILAWAVSYMGFSVTQAWKSNPDGAAGFFLHEYLQVGEAKFSFELVSGVVIPLLGVWALVLVILASGIQKGIERANRIFIPMLVVVFFVLVVRSLFLPGAASGLDALFTPNWSALLNSQVWIAAYSQIFFSLSVSFGIMLTYASYLKPRSNLSSTALVAAFANSSFEILAGIGVFATLGYMSTQQGMTIAEYGAEHGITGPVLSFITFPEIISTMPGGSIFGVIFFLSLTIAGVTSLLSLLQVVSTAVQEKFGFSASRSAVIVGSLSMVMSVVLYGTVNGLNALDVVDNWINNVGIVGIAIASTFVLTWSVKLLPELLRHVNQTSTFKLGRWWMAMVGVVTPAILTFIFVLNLREFFAKGYGGYDTSFLVTFGWGSVIGVVVISLLLSILPWRTPVVPFTPHPTAEELKEMEAAR